MPTRTLPAWYSGLKVVAVLHLCALVLQPVLAGQFFSGRAEALALHETLGEAAAALAAAQAGLAVGLAVCGRLSRRAAAGFGLIFVLVGLQVHLGHAGSLDVHIPLGAGLLAVSLVMTLGLFRRQDKLSTT